MGENVFGAFGTFPVDNGFTIVGDSSFLAYGTLVGPPPLPYGTLVGPPLLPTMSIPEDHPDTLVNIFDLQ